MADLTHASFFSGIGAFDLGFERAGIRLVSHAEVKPYSCAVLETRWPGVPNLGDINAICPDGEGDHECEIPRADVWSGGFPCSDFSIMGKRRGLLGGNRSSLGIVFLDLVRRHRPPFVVLENVPGLLSSHEGRDLGLLLDTLVDIGYGWSFRLLDARNFGLPQARRRLFVVAAADPRDAGAVLDDSTHRRLDAPPIGGPGGAALGGGGDGADRRDPFVLGPTYAPRSDAVVRTDGTTFPLTPNNYQYVPEPLTFRDTGGQHGVIAHRGIADPIIPPSGGAQRHWVAEPLVIERHGHFEPQVKRDGTAYTVLPVGAGGNIGQQYVVDEPVVLNGGFGVRPGQRLLSRADGSAYAVIPPSGNTGRQYVLDGGGGVLGDGRDGDGTGGGPGADGREPGPPAGDRRAHPEPERPPAGAGETADAGGVRAAAGLPGRVDDRVGGDDGPMGPQYLDTARWHVLGRACPVPITEWIGAGIVAVVGSRDVPLG